MARRWTFRGLTSRTTGNGKKLGRARRTIQRSKRLQARSLKRMGY